MPFETFVSSSRTVLGMAGAWVLRALGFLLRLAGNLGYYLCRMVVNVYDLIIFPALWLEALVLRKLATATSMQKVEKDRQATNEQAMTLLEEAAPCKKTAD
jgi:hypothetical protein